VTHPVSHLTIAPERLAQLGERALSQALDYWATVDARPSYPRTSAARMEDLFSLPWTDEGIGERVLDDFAAIADHGRPSGGRFFGYVLGSGEPVGALGELLAAALNQNVTSWRSSPAAATIEQTVIGWLADAVGCAGFTGSLCGGGSSANLMALAMAREARAPANEAGARPCAVYASSQAHMSIPKAVALLGIGRSNLRLIDVDDGLRMRVDALEGAIRADRERGILPVAIVATAGTVATGAIDPVPALARVARREDLWFHVDGAYGGLASLAEPALFAGLDEADSLSLDAHKWLYQPLECGCLLFRDPGAARSAFSHSGDYVRIMNEGERESFAFFDETLELSRRFRALKLWISLRYHGRAAFREAIDQDLRRARLLAEMIRSEPELEILGEGPLSAVCFGHRRSDNEAILRRVIQRGRVYLSNATVRDRFALRACFVNHRTQEEDVAAIVSEVLAAALEVAP
jgi:glutamate/tyrosine decarboxylase-like PLP-dependent enzyme